jgi:hypothetical protein
VDDDDRFAWRDLAPGDYGVMQSQCTQRWPRFTVERPDTDDFCSGCGYVLSQCECEAS